jgi:peroxiredoxin
MRRPSLWVLATSLFVFGAARTARAEGNDLTGQRAPEINVQEGVQGIATGTSLAAYRGEVVVLKFWFTRCPACRRSLPEFQTLYQRFAPRGVRFLAIAYDETSNVRTYLRSTGFTFPVAIDGGGVTATRYGVFTYPTTYVIGADGIVKAYAQLSAALLERELDAARATPRPGAARRPLASFPRPNAAAPAPGSPLPSEATPTTASVGTPETLAAASLRPQPRCARARGRLGAPRPRRAGSAHPCSRRIPALSRRAARAWVRRCPGPGGGRSAARPRRAGGDGRRACGPRGAADRARGACGPPADGPGPGRLSRARSGPG